MKLFGNINLGSFGSLLVKGGNVMNVLILALSLCCIDAINYEVDVFSVSMFIDGLILLGYLTSYYSKIFWKKGLTF